MATKSDNEMIKFEARISSISEEMQERINEVVKGTQMMKPQNDVRVDLCHDANWLLVSVRLLMCLVFCRASFGRVEGKDARDQEQC
jgi:hypothetical protein